MTCCTYVFYTDICLTGICFYQWIGLMCTDTCWVSYTVMPQIKPLYSPNSATTTHTYTSLLILPGGSQWQRGRDFTLDLPLTALWAPSLLPWFSWPTWSSRSKPLIIPTSHPVAHSLSLSLSNTHIHICLTHLLVGWFLPRPGSLALAPDCDWCEGLERKV